MYTGLIESNNPPFLPQGCEWVKVSSGTGSPRTLVVPDKGPLNSCVCMCFHHYIKCPLLRSPRIVGAGSRNDTSHRDIGTQWILDLCNGTVKEGSIPEDWKSSVVLPIYKGKGDPMECGSYRGIKLLEHAMKVVGFLSTE